MGIELGISSTWEELNASDPVFKHFYERRNFILHQEPETTVAQVNIETALTINMSVTLSMTITRADGSIETRESPSATPPKQETPPRSKLAQHFLFEDGGWQKKPATAYVEEFVKTCERFIAEAGSKFILLPPE